ncbi:MAG: hypothetical protein ABW043_12710 [Devosia sp.]|uniref:hypothetical protein n=1 Tax=Devosia sp. TaxID=1871048 RepID=UPI00339A35DE
MTLSIRNVVDAGLIDSERLVLRMDPGGDLGDYAVLLTYTDESGALKTGVKAAFWFPYKEVAAGSLVVIYTKAGEEKIRERKDGGHTYFYYWGETEPLWDDKATTAILLNAPNWTKYQNLGEEDAEE